MYNISKLARKMWKALLLIATVFCVAGGATPRVSKIYFNTQSMWSVNKEGGDGGEGGVFKLLAADGKLDIYSFIHN